MKKIYLVLLSVMCFLPVFWTINSNSFKMPHNNTIFSDVGIINTINEIRGESGNDLISRILYNKLFFGLVFINNSSRLIDLKILSGIVLVVSLIPLIYGVYLVYFLEKRPLKKYLAWTYLLAAFCLFGITYNIDNYLIYIVPLLFIFIYSGLNKLNSKIINSIIIVNFIIVLFVYILK